MRIRNFLYDCGFIKTLKLNIPVISVGNLTMGGSGKTPFVIYLVKYLQTNGKKVFVVSRPFPYRVKIPQVVSDLRHGADQFGDEPYLVHKLTMAPVIVSNSKWMSALKAQEMGADIVVVDDGFQHRKLARSLDLVLLNGAQSIQQFEIFPMGKGREPLRNLSRASLVIQTKKRLEIPNVNIRGLFASQGMSFQFGLGGPEVVPRKIVIVSAIAHNEEFRQSLADLDIRIVQHFAYPDHYSFSYEDVAKITFAAKSHGAQYVVCTEKDAVKLVDLWQSPIPLVSAKQNMTMVEGERELHAAVDRLFS